MCVAFPDASDKADTIRYIMIILLCITSFRITFPFDVIIIMRRKLLSSCIYYKMFSLETYSYIFSLLSILLSYVVLVSIYRCSNTMFEKKLALLPVLYTKF